MVKLLPVNLDINLRSWCPFFHYLSVILTDNKYLPWFAEKFIMMEIRPYSYMIHYTDAQFRNAYTFDEVLSIHTIKDKSDIIERLVGYINNNYYLRIVGNRALLDPAATQQLGLHAMLIFGYDLNQNVFHFHDVKFRGKLCQKHSITFEDFKNTFYSGLRIIKENNLQYREEYYERLTAFRTKPYQPLENREVHVPRIIRDFKRFYDGGEFYKPEPDEKSENAIWQQNKLKYGTSIYSAFHEDLYFKCFSRNALNEIEIKKLENSVGRGLTRLFENKINHLFRLNYLSKKLKINFASLTITELKELCSLISNGISFFNKYLHTMNKEYLDKFKTVMKESEMKDKSILEQIIFSLDSFIKTRW